MPYVKKPSRHWQWKPKTNTKPEPPKLPTTVDKALGKCRNLVESLLTLSQKGRNGFLEMFSTKNFAGIEDLVSLMQRWNRPWRELVTEELCRIGFTRLLYDIVVFIESDGMEKTDVNKTTATAKMYSLLQMFTDCSKYASGILAHEGIIDVLITNLNRSYEGSASAKYDKAKKQFIMSNLAVLSKLARIPCFKRHFDKAYATNTLLLYFESTDEDIQLPAVMALTCVQGGSSISYLEQQDVAIEKLAECLKNVLENVTNNGAQHKQYVGIFAEDFLECMVMAAVNDNNKIALSRLNITAQLSEILSQSTNEGELIQTVRLLHSLCFVKEVRDHLKDGGKKCVEALRNLTRRKENSILTKKALTTLAYLKTTESEAEFIENSPPTNDDFVIPSRHGELNEESESKSLNLLIFSSFATEFTVLEIKRRLAKEGYKVKLDLEIDNPESLQKELKNASMLLVCYGEDFFCSNRCRFEAEFTCELKKPVLPISMQSDYQSLGWLYRLICNATSSPIDFSLIKDHFNVSMSKLLQETRRRSELLKLEKDSFARA